MNLYIIHANHPEYDNYSLDLLVTAANPARAVELWRKYYSLDEDEDQPFSGGMVITSTREGLNLDSAWVRQINVPIIEQALVWGEPEAPIVAAVRP